jgi:hypothetical protein
LILEIPNEEAEKQQAETLLGKIRNVFGGIK